jgi:hypothetical protein|tara:strand:- start:95 stop:493 length:399 start_codon:yes stop_codon:yes gene_type:complete|eukprot:29337-Pelagococcus_subviridis.AAC.6
MIPTTRRTTPCDCIVDASIGDGAYAPSPNSARSISVGGDSGVPSGADDARGVVVVARRRAARREEEEDDDDGDDRARRRASVGDVRASEDDDAIVPARATTRVPRRGATWPASRVGRWSLEKCHVADLAARA